MNVKTESEVAQSCLTLLDPMYCSLSGSSAHGIFQARVLEWGAIAFSERGSEKVAIQLVTFVGKSFSYLAVQGCHVSAATSIAMIME